jgi:predicted site-specific integrase-resolvase
MSPKDEDPLLSPAEIAQNFPVDAATVRHWIKTTKLRTATRPVAGEGRYRASDVRRLLNAEG